MVFMFFTNATTQSVLTMNILNSEIMKRTCTIVKQEVELQVVLGTGWLDFLKTTFVIYGATPKINQEVT
jgi:hypothetical protein